MDTADSTRTPHRVANRNQKPYQPSEGVYNAHRFTVTTASLFLCGRSLVRRFLDTGSRLAHGRLDTGTLSKSVALLIDGTSIDRARDVARKLVKIKFVWLDIRGGQVLFEIR